MEVVTKNFCRNASVFGQEVDGYHMAMISFTGFRKEQSAAFSERANNILPRNFSIDCGMGHGMGQVTSHA